jgi:hypothetical protein
MGRAQQRFIGCIETKMRYIVVKAHEPGSQAVLTLSRGERLRFERRPTEWRGWLWCTTESGETGWVPEAWVKIEGDTCIVLRDYCSAELPVEVGHEVIGDLIESGWVWVLKGTGATGWVPLECLERLAQ